MMEDMEMGYSLTTCGHIVHRECHQQQMENLELPKGYKSEESSLSQLETVCPLCKHCASIFVIYAEPYVKQTQPKDLVKNLKLMPLCLLHELVENSGVSSNQFICLQETVNQEKIISQLYEFMTVLMVATQSEDQQQDGNNQFLSELQEKCTLFMLDSCFVNGLTYYQQKCTMTLLKNLFLSYKILRSVASTEAEDQYIRVQYLSKATYYLEQMINFVQYIDQKMARNVYNLDDVYIKFISAIVVLKCVESEDMLFSIIVSFTKEYLDHVVSLFAFLMLKQTEPKVAITQEEWSRFWVDQNNTLKVFSHVQPYHELILGTLFSIFDYPKDIIEKAVNSHRYNPALYEAIINKEFCQLPAFDPSYMEQLSALYTRQKDKMEILMQKNPQLKFQIHLEENFKAMHAKWFFRKCDLCHQFPETPQSELHVCLICNQQLCSISCQKDKKSNMNLFAHAQKMHAGFCVFYQV